MVSEDEERPRVRWWRVRRGDAVRYSHLRPQWGVGIAALRTWLDEFFELAGHLLGVLLVIPLWAVLQALLWLPLPLAALVWKLRMRRAMREEGEGC